MSIDYKQQLNEMKRLMNYGMNTNSQTNNSNSIVEYSQLGADGKTYGILKEGNKYYIKVAPKKHTKILTEDFDYLGGFLNRKPYDSYTKASHALNLQLISVNEAAGNKSPVQSQFNLNESAEWETLKTKEVREELDRFNQLTSNVNNILSENIHYINENDKTYCEKPTKAPNKKPGEGGQQQPLGIKQKDWTSDDSKVNPENAYNRYGVKGGNPSGSKYDAAHGINDIDMTQGNPYQEKSKTSKEQGKNIFENKKKIKLSEEQQKQILAWRAERDFVNDDDYMDMSKGTKIGDTSPWSEVVNENFETTEWDDGLPSSPSTGEADEYTEPYELNENPLAGVALRAAAGAAGSMIGNQISDNIDESDELLGDEEEYQFDDDYDEFIEDEEFYNSEDYDTSNDFAAAIEQGNMPNPNDIYESEEEMLLTDNEYDNSDEYDNFDGTENVLDDIPDTDEEYDFSWDSTAADEQGNLYGDNWETTEPDNLDRYISESIQNYFGKHPAYHKKVMTLPEIGDDSQWGRDWNDDSTKTNKPFGIKIGHNGDPYSELVDTICDAVITQLKKKL